MTTFNAIITAYCACRLCTPGHHVTATGTIPRPNRTIAVNGLPFGTLIKIGDHVYTVEDRMARRFKSNHIDIFMPNHAAAVKRGRHAEIVYVIRLGTPKAIKRVH